MRRLFLAIAFLLPLFVVAQKKIVQKEINQLIQTYNTPGISVAVVKNNKLIYSDAFGYQNVEQKKKLKTNHIFRIASISKSFTASAIMQLVEAGKVKLDDEAGPILGFTIKNPTFPNEPITIRRLLSHTSSLNDSQGYFTLDGINPNKSSSSEKCYSNYAPGTKYSYCNLNFNLLGTIVEKLSGVRFDEYIIQNILKPLGLYGGYWVDGLDKKKFASIYEYDSSGTPKLQPDAYHPRKEIIANYEMGYTTPVFSPTGGMKISAKDLAKYMMMHMNYGKGNKKQIISEESSKTMQTMFANNYKYGFALEETTTFIPGKTMVGHTGSAYGLNSAMFFQPEEKFGIVIIYSGALPKLPSTNNTLMREVVDVLYKNFIEKK